MNDIPDNLAFNELGLKRIFEVVPGITKLTSSDLIGVSDAEEIVLPESLEIIEDFTFEGLSHLEKVLIPESVKSIGIQAFARCSSLLELNLPKGLKEISQLAFWDCSTLNEIELPDTLEKIGDGVFAGCSCSIISKSNKFVYYNGALYSSNKDTLIHCSSSIDSFTVPDGVKKIEWGAFWGCSIERVVIPESVEYIGLNAFRDCCNLKEIVIPSKVKKINNYSFYRCFHLANVVLPKSLTSIGYCAFYRCYLQSVVIPESANSVSIRAFDECTDLLKEDGRAFDRFSLEDIKDDADVDVDDDEVIYPS